MARQQLALLRTLVRGATTKKKGRGYHVQAAAAGDVLVSGPLPAAELGRTYSPSYCKEGKDLGRESFRVPDRNLQTRVIYAFDSDREGQGEDRGQEASVSGSTFQLGSSCYIKVVNDAPSRAYLQNPFGSRGFSSSSTLTQSPASAVDPGGASSAEIADPLVVESGSYAAETKEMEGGLASAKSILVEAVEPAGEPKGEEAMGGVSSGPLGDQQGPREAAIAAAAAAAAAVLSRGTPNREQTGADPANVQGLERRGPNKVPKKKEPEARKEYQLHPLDPEAMLKTMEAQLHARRTFQTSQKEKEMIIKIFRRFNERGWAADQALALYVNSKFFPMAAARFRKFVLRTVGPELRDSLMALGPTVRAEEYLFPLFAEYCFNEFPEEIKAYRALVNSADMTKPHTWYPFARAMKRRIIYHRGPTNSGKTYNALRRLCGASSGVYCGPLRLLAMEVYDTVNMEGVYCNLVTGQERKEVPFAQHTSCTIEMANVTKPIEVAVIDEIQMINDEYRGWAWTRALLGLQAEEVHVCGDPSALPLLEGLCAATGDDLVHHEYERFVPLSVDKSSLKGNFANVEPGDCIVAFSRREIFEVKRQVELATSQKCCVVYGGLPPETRQQQAKLFNEPGSGYEVLVASDAVGMGLNLNIKRVVFYSLHKFNGVEKQVIAAPMVKQIAGRAGRRGSIYPEGVSTTFFSADVPLLVDALQQPVVSISAAGLFPFFEQVELFASQVPDVSFSKLLDRFAETTRTDGSYFLCRTDNFRKVALLLERVQGLSLEDRFNFCFAPANVRDPKCMAALLEYAELYSRGSPVPLALASPSGSARNALELMDLETRHQVSSIYQWLSQQLPSHAFPEDARAAEIGQEIATVLADTLMSSTGKRFDFAPKPNQYHHNSNNNKGPAAYSRPPPWLPRRSQGQGQGGGPPRKVLVV